MRRLILLRHAEADRPEGVTDHERPLSSHGRKQGAEMGKHLARQERLPQLAVVSSARRTQETWNLIPIATRQAIKYRDEPRIYEASLGILIQVVGQTPDDVDTLLLIGHNPGFEALTHYFSASGRPSA